MVQEFPPYLFHQKIYNIPFDAEIVSISELRTVKASGMNVATFHATAKDEDGIVFGFTMYGNIAKANYEYLCANRKITFSDWIMSHSNDDSVNIIAHHIVFH